MKWLMNIWLRLTGKGHLIGWPTKCDMCNGNFDRGVLDPISGDWWLCGKCLRDYMKGN